MSPVNGHPDVHVVAAEGLTYGVDDARELVRQSSLSPVEAPWNVFVVEDADRFTDEAVRALLKSIEEPPPHVVWILCAPSVEDVEPTIASRTRHVSLRTPTPSSVAQVLQDAYGVDPAMATFAARASQGHIGRARALATDEHARLRRQEVMRVPFELRDVPSCYAQAAGLMAAATEDARAITDAIDDAEVSSLNSAYGMGSEGVTKVRIQRLMSKDLKELTKAQESRQKRTVVDQVDRVIIDLMGLYRDVLLLQVNGDVDLINAEMHPQLATIAERSSPADTARRLQALAHSRLQLKANVSPQLILEALMVELRDPWIRTAQLV
jgi:DNA polymerase-3 subunit delta'